LTVAEQVHPAPAGVQVTEAKPSVLMIPDTPSHVTAVDEITKHDGDKVKCSSPVVTVLSE